MNNTVNAGLVRRIADRLSSTAVDDLVTNDEVKRLVGDDPRWRTLLLQARREINEEIGANFRTVYKVGLQRLASREIRAVQNADLGRIRRTAKRSIAKTANTVTRTNDLTNDEIMDAYAGMRIMGLIEQQAVVRSIPVVRAEIIQTHGGSTAKAAAESLERMRAALGRTRST